jgi:miniconductance mechanosensitive channel
MEESGGRRIKRHISIDMKSIKFCDDILIEKFKQIKLLGNYLNKKTHEIEDDNIKNDLPISDNVNKRQLTNIGIFRKYIEEYLDKHPKINSDMTFLIRQLQPNEKGLPIEIYVFSKNQEWVGFEAIQSDIFDHLLAIMPEFELKVFQNPTGDDFRKLQF